MATLAWYFIISHSNSVRAKSHGLEWIIHPRNKYLYPPLRFFVLPGSFSITSHTTSNHVMSHHVRLVQLESLSGRGDPMPGVGGRTKKGLFQESEVWKIHLFNFDWGILRTTPFLQDLLAPLLRGEDTTQEKKINVAHWKKGREKNRRRTRCFHSIHVLAERALCCMAYWLVSWVMF